MTLNPRYLHHHEMNIHLIDAFLGIPNQNRSNAANSAKASNQTWINALFLPSHFIYF